MPSSRIVLDTFVLNLERRYSGCKQPPSCQCQVNSSLENIMRHRYLAFCVFVMPIIRQSQFIQKGLKKTGKFGTQCVVTVLFICSR